MTPVYLNPPPSSFPFVDQLKEADHHHHPQQQQLFLSSHVHVAQDQDQRGNSVHQNDHPEVDNLCISQTRWSHDHHQHVHNPLSSCKREEDIGDYNYYYERNDGEGSSSSSAKWMPSKIRLMQKMVNSNCSSSETDKPENFALKFRDNNYNNATTTIRVCADCNTTTTPLWRSGPRGPKSLCNACGIRQRKARRAMAAAAAMADGTVVAMETSSTSLLSMKNKVHNKEKKSRSTSHNSQGRKLFYKPLDHPPQGQKKICFKNLALSLSKNSALQQVFPQDVEQAAILLMELSCGFIH